jgi:predicted nucleotidyltransferase component of viral defense system
MIQTSKQLKDKVRNLSKSDSTKAQTLIRNFIMERFLERITLSPYRNHFILKGGMLVAAVVGLDTRATMDIDTTVRNLSLTVEDATKIVETIMAVDIPDGVSFCIVKVSDIMEGHDYPGVRFLLEANLDRLCQTIKIDISTGDVITPGAVEFSYKLMLEDRSISIWTYNLETLLAEKVETVMARGTANTRMRDFYDIHTIMRQEKIDEVIFRDAFMATNKKRGTVELIPDFFSSLDAVRHSESMERSWGNYRKDSFFGGELTWAEVMPEVQELAELIFRK